MLSFLAVKFAMGNVGEKLGPDVSPDPERLELQETRRSIDAVSGGTRSSWRVWLVSALISTSVNLAVFPRTIESLFNEDEGENFQASVRLKDLVENNKKAEIFNKYSEGFENPEGMSYGDFLNFYFDATRSVLDEELGVEEAQKREDLTRGEIRELVDYFMGLKGKGLSVDDLLRGIYFEINNGIVSNEYGLREGQALLQNLLGVTDGSGNCEAYAMYYNFVAWGVFEDEIRNGDIEILLENVNIQVEGEKPIPHVRPVISKDDKNFVVELTVRPGGFWVFDDLDFEEQGRMISSFPDLLLKGYAGQNNFADSALDLKVIESNTPFSMSASSRVEDEKSTLRNGGVKKFQISLLSDESESDSLIVDPVSGEDQVEDEDMILKIVNDVDYSVRNDDWESFLNLIFINDYDDLSEFSDRFLPTMKYLNDLIQADPSNFANYFKRGLFLYFVLDDKKAAYDDLTKTIDVGNMGNITYMAYLFRAEYLYSCDRGDDTCMQARIDDYSAAVNINPYKVDGLFRRALLLEDRGDFKGAFRDYSDAISLAENNSQKAALYGTRGFLLSRMGVENYNAAIDDLEKSLKFDSAEKNIVNDLLLSMYKNIGNYDEALRICDNIISNSAYISNSSSISNFLTKADLYIKMQRYDEAARILYYLSSELAELDPDDLNTQVVFGIYNSLNDSVARHLAK